MFKKTKNFFSRLYMWITTNKIDKGEYYNRNNSKLILGNIKVGKNSRIGFGNFETSDWLNYRKNFLNNEGKIIIGENTTITTGYRIHCKGELIVGDSSYINPNCEMRIFHKLIIGNNCAISWNFRVLDDDLHAISINDLGKEKSGNIIIGNKVWIGANSTILKGSIIGNNSVVAAGSVVTGIFPDNVLIGGVPAKIIKENVSWK